jgi:hypothetical protein
MEQIKTVIIGALALACAASLNATVSASFGSIDTLRASRRTISVPSDLKRSNGAAHLLRVENVRLEAPVPPETIPSSLLKFDVFNGGSTPLTDLILEISILEKSAAKESAGRALVRPFQIRGGIVLQAGYTINYEMLLRSLPSDCRCVANVDVVSVHWLPEAGSDTAAERRVRSELR